MTHCSVSKQRLMLTIWSILLYNYNKRRINTFIHKSQYQMLSNSYTIMQHRDLNMKTIAIYKRCTNPKSMFTVRGDTFNLGTNPLLAELLHSDGDTGRSTLYPVNLWRVSGSLSWFIAPYGWYKDGSALKLETGEGCFPANRHDVNCDVISGGVTSVSWDMFSVSSQYGGLHAPVSLDFLLSLLSLALLFWNHILIWKQDTVYN